MKGVRILAVLVSLLSIPISASAFLQTQRDEQLEQILAKIAQTSPEGLLVLEKIQSMKPVVNEHQSTESLIDMVQYYAFDKDAYNLNVIGSAASPKRMLPPETARRWSIVFYYRDYEKQYRAAEWEYNEETNKIYPFEKENAPMFFESRPSKRRDN